MKPASKLAFSLFLTATTILATTATAEVVKLGDKVEVVHPVDAPDRGMTKQTVEKRFGKPLKVNPAVGKPPISSWEYPGYIVYFEGNYVIHTVATRQKH